MRKRKVSERIHWLESDYGGRRIYLCWNIRVGGMGLTTVYRTLLGKAEVNNVRH